MSLLVGLFGILRPILWLFLHFFSKFRERKSYESKFIDLLNDCREFDLVIHVSSEGEIELVHPILMSAIENGKQILMLFTSPSAERKVKALREKHPQSISYSLLRLTYAPFKNPLDILGNTEKFIMVRYDFFPELLSYGKRKANRCILVAATLIGKNIKSIFSRSYWTFIFSHFDNIYSSTARDKDQIKKLTNDSVHIEHFEFRIPRIINRLNKSDHIKNNSWFSDLESLFVKYPKDKRIILGSCWEIDLEIFNHPTFLKEIIEGGWLIFIAPHLLNEENINLLRKRLDSFNIDSSLLRGDTDKIDSPVIICSIPGILCEMYQFFSHAYVGGGFGRSVHSVLEPFFSSENIYFGPKVGRSTEVELAKEIDRRTIFTLTKPSDFFEKTKLTTECDMNIRKNFGAQSLLLEEKKLSKLL